MAARENQGLQIALIIFVMLTVILIVTTFFFFNSYKGEMEKNKSLATENSQKDTAARTANSESEQYKSIIGAAATDKVDAVQATVKKDLDTYGKTIPEGKQNYHFLVEFLGTELQNANARIADITAHEKELDDKVKSDEASKNPEIAKYTKELADATKDLDSERSKFNQDRKEITANKDQLEKRFDSKRKEHEQLVKESSEKLASMSSDNEKKTALLLAKNEEELRKHKTSEVPDGKITWVDQRTRIVWINLGAADGLRRLITFVAFGGDDTNPVPGTHRGKGKIEVTRLIDRHLAEARIVEDDLSNPLMPGDNIFSDVWEAGRAEHFALAGTIDIDGDGVSDRQKLHDLIALNGGIIDEEVTDSDKKTGEMSINTKYLVLGDPPKDEAKLKNYTEIRSEAQTLGVKIIRVKDFVDYLGYKPEDRTVNLGHKANPNDFKPRLPDGVQRTMSSGRTMKDLRKTPAPSDKDSR
jgi:hypothetical protein